MPTPAARLKRGARVFLESHVTWWQALAMFFILLIANYGVQASARSTVNDYADEQQRASDVAQYRSDVGATDSLRAGCNRANTLRQSAWNNAMIDADTRLAAATQYTDKARQTIVALAHQNVLDARSLVAAVDDIAVSPHSPQQDCALAYPAPEAPPGLAVIKQAPLPPLTVRPYKPTSAVTSFQP